MHTKTQCCDISKISSPSRAAEEEEEEEGGEGLIRFGVGGGEEGAFGEGRRRERDGERERREGALFRLQQR